MDLQNFVATEIVNGYSWTLATTEVETIAINGGDEY